MNSIKTALINTILTLILSSILALIFQFYTPQLISQDKILPYIYSVTSILFSVGFSLLISIQIIDITHRSYYLYLQKKFKNILISLVSLFIVSTVTFILSFFKLNITLNPESNFFLKNIVPAIPIATQFTVIILISIKFISLYSYKNELDNLRKRFQ